MLDYAPQLLRLRVRKLAEAKQFYMEVLGAHLESESADSLCFLLNYSTIVCTYAPELGEQGRVAESYHLSDGRYALVSQRVDVRPERWRNLSIALKRYQDEGDRRSFSGSIKHSSRRCARILDPSGNPLEISAPFGHLQRVFAYAAPSLWLGMCAVLIAMLAYAAISARDHQVAASDASNSASYPHRWP